MESIWTTKQLQDHWARASALSSSSNAGRATSQSASSLQAPPAIIRLPGPPPTRLPAHGLPPGLTTVINETNQDTTDGLFPQEANTPPMQYPAQATVPETTEGHSFYAVNFPVLEAPANFNESLLGRLDPRLDPGLLRGWDPRFNFQYNVQMDIKRLWIEKQAMMPPPGSTAAASGMTNPQNQESIHHQNDLNMTGSTPHGRAEDTPMDLHESVNWNDTTEEEDLDGDSTMSEGTPRDPSLVSEKEWILPPWDHDDPEPTLSLAPLSSMAVWSPELDPDFQTEAQWHLNKWDDCRFKLPQTSSDIDSLQQALEITRMDFWIQNPLERYPEDLSAHEGESYGSQHRRLQHAFCRIWRDLETEPAPLLYRLPPWLFGFDRWAWKSVAWGTDRRSSVYNQGLNEMATVKIQRGLKRVSHRYWKARLEELRLAVDEEEDRRRTAGFEELRRAWEEEEARGQPPLLAGPEMAGFGE